MNARTLGVEEEFLLIQPDGSLVEAGHDVAARAAERGDGQFEHELKRAQAELGSKPASSLDDLASDLIRLRTELARTAEESGALLLASGTHPTVERARTTAEHRYERMTRVFGVVARKQLTCGMHVHVGVDSPDEGVAVVDSIRPYLAVLVALSANSPFHGGEDTGYASYRTVLWGQWPSAGPTQTFGDLAGYRRVAARLIASGAALDEGMLYFDARLSANYPTVEVRVADVCVDVQLGVAIAALARALVETAASGDLPPALPTVEELRARVWRAARWGMSGELLDAAGAVTPAWDCVGALMEILEPALKASGDLAVVSRALSDLRAHGTGADRQRAQHRAGGFPALYEAFRVGADGEAAASSG